MINRKYIYLGVIFLLLIIIKFINPPIIKKISFISYDFYQKAFNRGEVKDVTIVDIDEKSIAKVGQFPWRRDIYSKILYNLNQHSPELLLLISSLVKKIGKIHKIYFHNYKKKAINL